MTPPDPESRYLLADPDASAGTGGAASAPARGGVVFVDRDLRVRWLSPGLLPAGRRVAYLADLVGPADEAALRANVAELVAGEAMASPIPVEMRVGDVVTQGIAEVEALDPAAAPGPFMVTIVPNDRRGAGGDVHFRASHDQLTALPNRWTLEERLSARIAADRDGASAVMLLDLDRLKVVNDSLGHEAGDRLLAEVARRLGNAVGDAAMVSRIGGDEFVVLVEEAGSEHDVTRLGDAVLEALRPPILLRERRHVVTASIGIVFIEGHDDAAGVLRDADIAMYEAKAQGRDRYCVFDEIMRARAVSRFDVEEDLRRGLAEGEFCLYYQPQVSTATGRIASAEALIRWQHTEHGLVFPGAFVGITEETGVIRELGAFVLAEACRAAVTFGRRSHNGTPIGMSVNLSPIQLGDLHVVEAVTTALAESGLAPESLTLELTESSLVSDDPIVVLALNQIRDLGVRIAIDDFGTGYSSLSYLSRVPAHELKIDRAFVSAMTDEAGVSVVNGICQLARGVGLSVVAEGVESDSEAALVVGMECDLIQGFLVSRAVPEDEFVKQLVNDTVRDFRRGRSGSGDAAAAPRPSRRTLGRRAPV